MYEIGLSKAGDEILLRLLKSEEPKNPSERLAVDGDDAVAWRRKDHPQGLLARHRDPETLEEQKILSVIAKELVSEGLVMHCKPYGSVQIHLTDLGRSIAQGILQEKKCPQPAPM